MSSTRVQRFVVLGVLNSIFGFAVFAAFQLALGRILHYILVLCLAHVVAVLESYAVQRRYVWRSRDAWLPELFRFFSVYLGVLALNIPLLLLFVEFVRLPVVVAQGCTILIFAVGSYLVHRSFTFHSPKPSAVVAEDNTLEAEPDPHTRERP
ncbi:MAG: GtrA family protein [Actinobacteria bacterium]|nr:GtrA family protein [Actinomycetota bacterium]MBW3647381.1 GtrA family protein [Actinomycetota bacterium]